MFIYGGHELFEVVVMIFLIISANCDIVYVCHSTLQFLIRNDSVYYPLKTCDPIWNPKRDPMEFI